jgi:hypothetical protein
MDFWDGCRKRREVDIIKQNMKIFPLLPIPMLVLMSMIFVHTSEMHMMKYILHIHFIRSPCRFKA